VSLCCTPKLMPSHAWHCTAVPVAPRGTQRLPCTAVMEHTRSSSFL
jgi:hypothetical protein